MTRYYVGFNIYNNYHDSFFFHLILLLIFSHTHIMNFEFNYKFVIIF